MLSTRKISVVLRPRSISLGGHPRFVNGAWMEAHTGLKYVHHNNSKRNMLSASADVKHLQSLDSWHTKVPSAILNQLQMS